VSRAGQRLAVARSDGQVLRYSIGVADSPDVVETNSNSVQFLVATPDRFWCVVRKWRETKTAAVVSPEELLELQEWNWTGMRPLRTVPLDALLRSVGRSDVDQWGASRGSPQLVAFRLVERDGRPTAVAVVAAGTKSTMREADLSQPLPLDWRELVKAPFQGAGPASVSRQLPCQDVACSPDGERGVTIGGRQACLWTIDGTPREWQATTPLGPHSVVSAVGIAPDSQHLVTGSWDRTLKCWKVERDGERQLTGQVRRLHREWIPQGGVISQIAFFPNGEQTSQPQRFWFATGHQDGQVRVWSWNPEDDPRPQLRKDWTPPPATGPGVPVESLCIDPEGRWLAFTNGSAVWMGELRHESDGDWTSANWQQLPDRPTGQPANTELAPADAEFRKTCLGYSRDGALLAVGGDDAQIRLWNTQTRTKLLPTPLAGHSLPIRGLAFSEAGDRLVSVSDDGTARVWVIPSADSEKITSRELMTLRFATSRDPTSRLTPRETGGSQPVAAGEDSGILNRNLSRLGRAKGVLFLPGDAALVVIGTSESETEHQMIVWPAEGQPAGRGGKVPRPPLTPMRKGL
jgi:WD40 repeat protein